VFKKGVRNSAFGLAFAFRQLAIPNPIGIALAIAYWAIATGLSSTDFHADFGFGRAGTMAGTGICDS